MLIVMVIGTSEVVISSTRPGLPKSASKYVAQIYGILDGRIWTVSLLPALKSSSKCFSATLFTVTAKRPAKSQRTTVSSVVLKGQRFKGPTDLRLI